MKSFVRWLWFLIISLILVACSSVQSAKATRHPVLVPKADSSAIPNTKSQKNGAFFQSDGPPNSTLANLDITPDAIPRNEPPIQSANLPYSSLGMSFRPQTGSSPYQEVGLASWYGKQFHGRKTSSGEVYNMFAMTAAHPTLPIPSYARVTNLKNGHSIIVRVNDRGPFHSKRVMDLSYAAAHKLGFTKTGTAKVEIERVWAAADGKITTTAPKTPAQAQTPRYIQLASFSKLSKAEAMLKQYVSASSAPHYEEKLNIVNQKGVYKVRLGPFLSNDAAKQAASAFGLATITLDA